MGVAWCAELILLVAGRNKAKKVNLDINLSLQMHEVFCLLSVNGTPGAKRKKGSRSCWEAEQNQRAQPREIFFFLGGGGDERESTRAFKSKRNKRTLFFL